MATGSRRRAPATTIWGYATPRFDQAAAQNWQLSTESEADEISGRIAWITQLRLLAQICFLKKV